MAQSTLLSYFQKAPSVGETIPLSHQPRIQQRREPAIKLASIASHNTLLRDEPSLDIPRPKKSKQNDTHTDIKQRHQQQQHPPSTTNTTSPQPQPIDTQLQQRTTTTISPSITPSPPPPFTIHPISPTHISALQSLTSTTLPVRYPPKFYTECHSSPSCSSFTYVVLLNNSQPVGWIACRAEPIPDSDPRPRTATTTGTASPSPADGSSSDPTSDESRINTHHEIYIRALTLLAPYRSLGLASHLLSTILHDPTNQHLLLEYKIRAIYAHVWEANTDALEWYEKRGFVRGNGGRKVEGYYKRLRPSGAWLVRRGVGVGDYLGGGG